VIKEAKYLDFTLQKRICECCKDPKTRYFVFRQGRVQVMADTLRSATKAIEKMTRLNIDDEDLKKKIAHKCKNDWGLELTDDEVKMCIYEMEETGLSIFFDQIWPNRRKLWNKDKREEEVRLTWDKTIDGYRTIAERSGTYAGIGKPEYETDSEGNLVSSTIEVYKFVQGQKCAFAGQAFYSEFVQKAYDKKTKELVVNRQWSNSPYHQLSIAAERQALRKAFQEINADLSKSENVLIDSETEKMEDDEGEQEVEAVASKPSKKEAPEKKPEPKVEQAPAAAPAPAPEVADKPAPKKQGPSSPFMEDKPKDKTYAESVEFGKYYLEGQRVVFSVDKSRTEKAIALDNGDAVLVRLTDHGWEEVSRKQRKKPEMGGFSWDMGMEYYDGSMITITRPDKKRENHLWLGLDNGYKVLLNQWGKEVERSERKKASANDEDSKRAKAMKMCMPLIKKFNVKERKAYTPRQVYGKLFEKEVENLTAEHYEQLYQELSKSA